MKQRGKFKQLIQSDTPVLVDFSAEWCGPCRALAPILKEVKSTLKNEVKIVKIDVDRNPQLAGQYQVRSVPTLMLFQHGKMKWRQSGVVQAKQLLGVLKK
ncbi:MAG: thioredoxin [Bacteroidota bacterium]